MDAGFQLQIGAVQHGPQEAPRGAPAPPPALIHLKIGRAEIVAAVEVGDRRDAGGRHRRLDHVEDRPMDARMLDAPFAAGAMQ